MNYYRKTYRFRLWFAGLGGDIVNDRQKRLTLWLLAWGPKGCDSYNYKIALVMRCSVRTIQLDLRRLEKYHLIVIDGALGKYRRIKVPPWSKKRHWKRSGHDIMLSNRGAGIFTHQKRHRINSMNYVREQRKLLLHGKAPESETGKTPADSSSRGAVPPNPPGGSDTFGRLRQIVYNQLVKKLVKNNWSRDRAQSIAAARLEQLYEQQKRKEDK